MSAPPSGPDVSAVVVSYNAREELLGCLAALHADASRLLEVFVVDNASSDGSPRAVRDAYPAVRVLENPDNRGFSRANNQALREATGRYALVLNSDARLAPGALATLAARLDADKGLAAVGPRTRYPDGRDQLSYGPRLTPLREWRQRRLVRGVRRGAAWALAEARRRATRACEPDWLSGACLLARRDALLAVGLFDEDFFLYEEDADLCLRLRRAGWRLAHVPEAELVHSLGASVAAASVLARLEYQRSHLLYYRKHNGSARTLLLRLAQAASALAGLALAAGPDAAEERRLQRRVLALALRGS